MFNHLSTRTGLMLGAAMAVLAATGAQAQDADSEGLNEIVVTAERRPENIQDVPLSVAVVSGADARDFAAGGEDTLLSLAGRVPSLYVETTTGRIFPRFYIRGLGNIDFYLGASQPVSIIQDDVILEHVVLKSNPVYDLAQIEVLRGPQGSLFGRNTTAGIVKFDTIRPSDEFKARASASYGSYNSVNVDAGVGGPIVDGVLSFRLSGLVQHREDWVDNVFAGTSADGTATPMKNAMGGYDDRNGRLQLLLTPGDRFSLLASAHARSYQGTSTLFLRGALRRGSNSVSHVDRDTVAFDEAANNPQGYTTYGGSVNASYDFGGVTLTSITAYETTAGYSRGDTDGGAASLFGSGASGQSMGKIADLDQWSQELRLASDSTGPLRWQVGGFYFDSRDTTEFYQRSFFLTTAARDPNNFVRLRNVNTSWALFGQASYDLTPALTVTAGARITEDKKQTRLVRPRPGYAFRTFVELKDTKPSWDVSAQYRFSEELSVYARVAQGFRGPTIQGRSAVFNSDFTTADSETILSWEAGVKGQIGNTLRFSAAAFYYTVDDIQLNGNDSNGNGVLFNADKAQAYGAEAELEWRPVRNFALSIGGSVLHSEIKDQRVYAQACALGGVLVCNVNDPIVTRTVFGSPAYFAQIDGNPLPNAPTYNLNLAARYDLPVSDSGKFFISTDWNMQGKTSFVLYDSDEFTSEGNFEGGLKIGYSHDDGAWEIAAFARNITNEKNLKGVIENYMAAVLNEPRVIGLSLSGRY